MASVDLEGNIVLRFSEFIFVFYIFCFISLNGIHCISKFNVRDFLIEKQMGIIVLFTFVSNQTSNLNILLALNNGTTIQNLCMMALETSTLNHYKSEIIVCFNFTFELNVKKDHGIHYELYSRIIKFP